MKKTIRILAAVLALTFGANLVAAPKADAMLIIDVAGPYHHLHGGELALTVVACIILLPLCILDQKVDGVPTMTRQQLIDNAYTPAQADQIVTETQALSSALMAKSERLVIAPTDTQATIAQNIRSVLPSASDLFVDFYTQQLFSVQ